jgi:hypothetical protein
LTTAIAFASRAGVLCPTVHTSPPSGVTGLSAGVGPGIGTMPKFSPVFLVSTGSCQGPFTIIAALPAANWSLTSACDQLTTDLLA